MLPELLFRDAPQLFAWDQVRYLDAVTIFGLRPQVDGLYCLAVLRVRDPGLARDPVDGSREGDWLQLVPNVKRATWRFFDPTAGQWLDILPKGSKRPSAIELQLQLAEDESPRRIVFWLPPAQPTDAGSMGQSTGSRLQ